MILEILIVICSLCVLLYGYFEAKRDVFSPVVLACFMLFIFYLADALYIIVDSSSSDSFWLSGQIFLYDQLYFVDMVGVVLLSSLFWVVGDYVGKALFGSGLASSDLKIRSMLLGSVVRSGAIPFCILITILTAVMLVGQIQNTVGLSVYLNDMASRAIVFEAFTMQNALLHVVLLFSMLCASFQFCRGKDKAASVFLMLCCVSVALVTGGRAIVLMMVVIYFFVNNSLRQKITINASTSAYIVFLVLLLPFAALLTRTSSEFYEGEIFANIFNTGQIPQANNILLLAMEGKAGELGGESFLYDIVSFVPSFVFDLIGFEKQLGGNTFFTEQFWPERWEVHRSQISLGGIGEAYYNFGLAGLVIFTFILAFAYRYAYALVGKLRFSGDLMMFVFFLRLPLFWSIFQQFRGDYFHAVNKFFLFSVAIFVFCKFFIRAERNG